MEKNKVQDAVSISPAGRSTVSIVSISGVVTGQVELGQVSQAEQSRVQQTLAADWRKRRQLQDVEQSLSLFMNGLVGRDRLQGTKNQTELQN